MPEDFAADLLTWYRLNKRSLPWREREDDAYAVWISEIMLQQTTVNAVIGFYNRWMKRFPTVESLAEATLDDVLKQWAGLGYYARARNLKKAAEEIVSTYDGALPNTVRELMTLPGIGRYTAGAISSISYGMDSPIVDANVIRVLCRLFALRGDPKGSTAVTKKLWEIAEALLPPGEAGDFNQAMMELGALVCTPAAPKCLTCPAAQHCRARRLGDPAAFPELGESRKWLDVIHAACFVEVDGKLLVVQRPLDQLWGGLWELPRVAVSGDESAECAAIRAVRETVGLEVELANPIGTIRHVVTNRRVTLHGFRATWDRCGELASITCSQFAWATSADLENYAISSPQRSLLKLWEDNRLQTRFDV